MVARCQPGAPDPIFYLSEGESDYPKQVQKRKERETEGKKGKGQGDGLADKALAKPEARGDLLR